MLKYQVVCAIFGEQTGGGRVKIYISLVSDFSSSSIVNYQTPFSETKSFVASFSSIVPMLQSIKPDLAILLVPTSLFTYLSYEEITSSTYTETENTLISFFRNKLENARMQPPVKVFEQFVEANGGKEPEVATIPSIGKYISKSGYQLIFETTATNVQAGVFYKLWRALSKKIFEFALSDDQNLEVFVDLTHGFNYLQYFVNQVTRDILRIVSFLLRSPKRRKEVSLIVATYSPYIPGVDFLRYIEAQRFKNVVTSGTVVPFELDLSQTNRIVLSDIRDITSGERRVDGSTVAELTRFGLTLGVSALRGLPLHATYSLYKLHTLNVSETVDRVMALKANLTQLEYAGNEVKFFDEVRFSPNMINLLRALVFTENFSAIFPKFEEEALKYECIEHRTETYFSLELLEKLSELVWHKDNSTGRLVFKELSNIRASVAVEKKNERDLSVIRESDFDTRTVFNMGHDPSDWQRNFFAHAGLAHLSYAFIKRPSEDGKYHKIFLTPLEKVEGGRNVWDLLISQVRA